MSPALRSRVLPVCMAVTFGVLVAGLFTDVAWLDGLGTLLLGLAVLVFAREAAEPRFPLMPKEPERRRTVYRVIGAALAVVGLIEIVAG